MPSVDQQPQPQPTNSAINDFKRFDYVIIGGGTAGLACAAKLSEDPNITVGVLEAGQWRPEDPKIDYPVMMGQTIMDPNYDWCLKSVPQKHSNNREYILPRGKVLGGSSALNFLCWQRGHAADFDAIEELGNPGWDWKSLTPFYKAATSTHKPKSKIQTSHLARLKDEHHGDSGAVKISFSNWYCEAQEMWLKMLKELGHADAEDGVASGDNSGIWNCPGTVDPATKKRSYAASAFYAPNASRSNYKVLTGAQVSFIELEESSGEQKAVAVHFVKDGTEQIVRVGKEVIVSAGSLKSPQVLELSGIGNTETLKAAGVPVKVDNSGVGKNLQEHLLLLGPCFQLDEKKVVTWDSMRKPEFAEKAMEMFHAKDPQEGERGIIGATISGFAFQSMESFLTSEEIKEVHQLIKQGDTTGWSQGMKETNQLQLEKWLVKKAPAMEQIFMPGFFSPDGAPKEGAAYYTNAIALQYPFSRGSAHISSSDPLAPPTIDPNYFSNAGDLRLMALYLKHIVENAEQNLKQIVLEVHAPSPGKCKTVEDYEEYIKNFAGTTYHPVGTCSMMSKEKGGVVDSKLKVYGTTNIRVADASILPIMPSGHILSACYVIGLKAADLIKQDIK